MEVLEADVAVFSCSLWRRAKRGSVLIARQSLVQAEAAHDPSATECWRLVLEHVKARAAGGPCPLRLNCKAHACAE